MPRILLTILSFIAALPSLWGYDPMSLKKTHGDELGVFIMGSILNTVKDNSVALVKETKSGKVLAVKKGHSILDNKYRVLEVTSKYMILSPKTGAPVLVYHDKFAGEFTSPTPSGADGPSMVASSYSAEGFERVQGSIRISSSFREKMVTEDLSKILMDASAIPHYEGGEIKGFKLLQITKGSIYENAGFMDEDVITSINGVPLTSIGGAIKLLHAIKKENRVEVDVLRNGQTFKTDITVN